MMPSTRSTMIQTDASQFKAPEIPQQPKKAQRIGAVISTAKKRFMKYLPNRASHPSATSEEPNNNEEFTPTTTLREYKMDHGNRRAIILDHYEFDDDEMEKREPKGADAKKLKRVLKKYGFSVETHVDLRLKELTKLLEKAASDDYTNVDCVLVAVMTHGNKKELYAHDWEYKTEKLWTPFTQCPTLIGKPKIFIIQACRGKKRDFVCRRSEDYEKGSLSTKIPKMADILVVYSSFEDYVSLRHVNRGAWFIQCVCKLLEKNEDNTLDFIQILTLANNQIATDHEFWDGCDRDVIQRQTSCFMSSLTRLLYIRKVSCKNPM